MFYMQITVKILDQFFFSCNRQIPIPNELCIATDFEEVHYLAVLKVKVQTKNYAWKKGEFEIDGWCFSLPSGHEGGETVAQ